MRPGDAGRVGDRRVPGEGIEPSRAEAHGFLRPARLPIPPSRPSAPSVPAVARLIAAIVATIAAAVGCSSAPAERPGPRIAFVFDGSTDEADEVSGPALAGLRFAALGTGDPETIQPVNVGLDVETVAEDVRAVVDDRGVVAAVVAPWTVPTEQAAQILTDADLPIVSLSPGWHPPPGTVGRSLSIDLSGEASLLVRTAFGATSGGRPPCVAGDLHPASAPLTGAVEAVGHEVGSPVRRAGAIDPARPATADAVAGRARALRCDVAIWTGGVDALELLLDAAPELTTIVGSSRIKTSGGIGLGITHPARRLLAVCGCADIDLSPDARLRRFIHDFQAESGGAPGAYAVEAYDAGRALISLGSTSGREGVAAGIVGRTTLPGLLGTYRFRDDGALVESPVAPGAWRASGSRWLPLDPRRLPPLATGDSALPLAAVLPIVRRRTRPPGADRSSI